MFEKKKKKNKLKNIFFQQNYYSIQVNLIIFSFSLFLTASYFII